MSKPATPISTLFHDRNHDRRPGLEAEVQALYGRWKATCTLVSRSAEDEEIWSEATKLLLQTFSEEKVFYPTEKYMRFYGYSREARALSRRKGAVEWSANSGTSFGKGGLDMKLKLSAYQ